MSPEGLVRGSTAQVCTGDGDHRVDARGRHLNGRDGLGLAIPAPLQLQHACKHHRRFIKRSSGASCRPTPVRHNPQEARAVRLKRQLSVQQHHDVWHSASLILAVTTVNPCSLETKACLAPARL